MSSNDNRWCGILTGKEILGLHFVALAVQVVHSPTVNVTRFDPHPRRRMWIDGAVVLSSALLIVYLPLSLQANTYKFHFDVDEGNQRIHFLGQLRCATARDRILGRVFYQWLLRENMLYKNYAILRVPFWPHSIQCTPKFLPSLPFQDFWMIYAPSQKAFLKFRIAAWGQPRRKRVHANPSPS